MSQDYYIQFNHTRECKSKILEINSKYELDIPLKFIEDKTINLWKDIEWKHVLYLSRIDNYNRVYFRFCEKEYWETELNPIYYNSHPHYEIERISKSLKDKYGEETIKAFYLVREDKTLNLNSKRQLIKTINTFHLDNFREEIVAIEFTNGKFIHFDASEESTVGIHI